MESLAGEALPLDNGGNVSRDFIFVQDVVDGLIACAGKGVPGESYNLATGVETTILDIALKINEIVGNKTSLELKPARDWDRSGKRFGSTWKSLEKLGYKAEISVEQGLQQTIDWTKENKIMVERSVGKHDAMMLRSE